MRREQGERRHGVLRYRSAWLPVLVVVLCALALEAPARPMAQGAAAALPLPSNVLVDVNRTEPSLAINPRQPLNVVLASNPNYASNVLYRYPPGFFFSSDGGQIWRGAVVAMPPQYGTGADTSVAFDSAGTAYLGMVGEGYNSFCGRAAHTAAILVAHSDDGGRSLSPPAVVDSNAAGESADKPYLTTWDVPATPHRAAHAVVAIVWTRSLPAEASQIMIARSQDGGRTFAPAQVIYTSAGPNLGALPAAGPHGALYVAWETFTKRSARTPKHIHIEVARSFDGGVTFSHPVSLPSTWDLPTMLPNGNLRVFAMPALAVDAATGTVYVAWARARLAAPGTYVGMAADVVLSRSRDGGVTWSAPVALNDSPAGDRFMPSLALLPGGVLAAIFYDRRVDGRAFDVYLAGVRDFGSRLALYPNRRLTQRSSPVTLLYYIRPGSSCVAPGRFLGDYITLSADVTTNTFGATWADMQPAPPWALALRYSRLPVSSALVGTPRLFPVDGSDATR